jgi:hypothetical protein
MEQLIAEVSQTPMRALIAEAANVIVSIEPPTPTLAANSCSRSEQQVMMVAVPRNQLNLRFGSKRVISRVNPLQKPLKRGDPRSLRYPKNRYEPISVKSVATGCSSQRSLMPA